jgi:hypothetical protein
MMTLTVPAFDGVKQVAKRIITIVEQEWALCAKDGRTSMLFEPWTYEDVPELLFRSNSWEKFRDPAPPVRTIDPEVRLRHLLKLAADIPLEMTGLDIRWQSAIKHVASLIDHDGFDKVSMEKNALAVLGLDVLPELNAIRDSLKLPMLDMSREKFASIEDRLIGSETPITEKLREARTIRTAYAEKSAALAATRDQLAQARQEVRRG